MVCQFLLHNKVNQLYIYICPHISSLLHLPPSHPPYPTPPGGHKAPSRSPCAMQLLPTSYLLYIWWCIYVHATLLCRPSLPFPLPVCCHFSLTFGSSRIALLMDPQAPLLQPNPDHPDTSPPPSVAQTLPPRESRPLLCDRGSWCPFLCIRPSALGQVMLSSPLHLLTQHRA